MGGDGEQLVSNKIEISIPIFLRKQIQQILSIGKSIKIIRFIESENRAIQKNNLGLPTDFYVRYKKKLTELVSNPYQLRDTTKG